MFPLLVSGWRLTLRSFPADTSVCVCLVCLCRLACVTVQPVPAVAVSVVCSPVQVLLQMRPELRSDAEQSGSEDEARGSDSPLLGDQGTDPASPSERDGGDLWTAGGSPSRAEPEEDGLSLHSLTGLDRLFSGL